jgi:hypothetical protein
MWLQLPAHAGTSPDFYTLKMEAILSSETSVYAISIRHHIPEDGILVSPFSGMQHSTVKISVSSLQTNLRIVLKFKDLDTNEEWCMLNGRSVVPERAFAAVSAFGFGSSNSRSP